MRPPTRPTVHAFLRSLRAVSVSPPCRSFGIDWALAGTVPERDSKTSAATAAKQDRYHIPNSPPVHRAIHARRLCARRAIVTMESHWGMSQFRRLYVACLATAELHRVIATARGS